MLLGFLSLPPRRWAQGGTKKKCPRSKVTNVFCMGRGVSIFSSIAHTVIRLNSVVIAWKCPETTCSKWGCWVSEITLERQAASQSCPTGYRLPTHNASLRTDQKRRDGGGVRVRACSFWTTTRTRQMQGYWRRVESRKLNVFINTHHFLPSRSTSQAGPGTQSRSLG